jgi:F-box protein 28
MAARNETYSRALVINDLPTDALIAVLRFLSYDEISQKRLVSRRFNQVCGGILTSGLKIADELKSREWKRMRALLPRRESERRLHHLSRHLEVLSSLDTRMALLNMTYQRYIDGKFCPFIPGKVRNRSLTFLAVFLDFL